MRTEQEQTIKHNLAIDIACELTLNEFFNKFLTVESNQGNVRITDDKRISKTDIDKIRSLINRTKICKENNLKVWFTARFRKLDYPYDYAYDFVLISKNKINGE